MRRSRQEAPFACWRKDGESREMPRCRVVYRCKSGCFRCGRKSVVSPFVKTNGQLICRSCYCFEKWQSAESEEASTAGQCLRFLSEAYMKKISTNHSSLETRYDICITITIFWDEQIFCRVRTIILCFQCEVSIFQFQLHFPIQ